MFDVITFGSATFDIFARSKNLKIIDCADFPNGKAMAIGAGAKVYIEEMVFASGGGGTNSAATFARQELETAYVGLVGEDANGRELLQEMAKLGANTSFMKITKLAKTPCSIILSGGEERSILVFEGASHLLAESDIDWRKIKKTKWFYVAGLSGESSKVFGKIIDFAKENGIKVAVNPGKEQLGRDLADLKKLLPKIDILLVNQEEASQIAGVDFKNEEELFRKFDELVPGIAVMSKGKEGVSVSDGKNIHRAGIPESGYVDRTGAGDAFGSGFVSKIIAGASIQEAIQFGTANATSIVQQVGAKNGLLKKGEWGQWPKVEVSQQPFK
ncbi:MAG: carbohydrate kinase family protein [Candidatus Portnoybacteria bacterium]|jgi:ribokinase|nr:carbohydrate kinase family protein [Candidatus Portnoybacteria bacterium]